MDRFVFDSVLAGTERELAELFDRAVAGFGVKYYAYHFLARNFRKQDLLASLRCYKVPDGWLDRYIEQDYFSDDPIQKAAAQRSELFFWDEIRTASGPLSAKHRAFFEDLASAGFGAGVSVPVFSQPGVFAYFCFGSGAETIALSSTQLLQLQVICYVMHLRYDQLADARSAPDLSPRERQVAALVVEGRTNQEIAERLSITTHTVDTLVKRCFAKLDVTSRVELALSAVSRGLALISAARTDGPTASSSSSGDRSRAGASSERRAKDVARAGYRPDREDQSREAEESQPPRKLRRA